MEVYVIVQHTYDYYEFTNFIGLALTAEARDEIIENYKLNDPYTSYPIIDKDATPEKYIDSANMERCHYLFWKEKVKE